MATEISGQVLLCARRRMAALAAAGASSNQLTVNIGNTTPSRSIPRCHACYTQPSRPGAAPPGEDRARLDMRLRDGREAMDRMALKSLARYHAAAVLHGPAAHAHHEIPPLQSAPR